MNTKALILSQLQEQMNMAVEAIEAGEYLPAIAAYGECVRLTQMLEMESKLKQEIAQPHAQGALKIS